MHIHIVLSNSSGLNLYIVHALVFVCVKVCMLSTVTVSFTVSYFMSDYVPSQLCTCCTLLQCTLE